MHVQEEFVSIFSAISCRILVDSGKISSLPPPVWTVYPAVFSAYPPPSCWPGRLGTLFHVYGGLGSGTASVVEEEAPAFCLGQIQ